MIFLFTNSVFYDMIIIPHKTKLFGIIARIFNYVKNASSFCVLLYRKKFCVVTIPSSAFLSVAQNCCHAFFIIKIYFMEVKDYEKKSLWNYINNFNFYDVCAVYICGNGS